MGGWVSAAARFPRRAITLVAVLLSIAAAAIPGLSVDTDSSRMLSPELPFQARANVLNAEFPALRDTLIVVVRGESAETADAVTGALADALAPQSGLFHRVFAPAADPYMVAHGLLYLSPEELDLTLARLSKAADLLAMLRSDPSLEGFLGAVDAATALAGAAGADAGALAPLHAEAAAVLAADGQGLRRPFRWVSALSGGGGPATRILMAVPRLDFTRLSPAAEPLRAIRQAVAGLDPAIAEAVEIGVTGEPALRAEEMQSATSRLPLSFALSMLLVAALLRLALGSLSRAGLALAALVVTLILTGGFAALTVGALNLISIAFVVLMVGLGIDYAIHFIAHFDEHHVGAPARAAALGQTGRAVGPALALSAATTAVAFLSFATTDFVGMAQLGLIGAGGVVIAFAVAMTLIPAALTLWPRLADGPAPRPVRQPSARITRPLAWLVAAAGLAALAVAPQARFDADPMNLRDPASPSVATYRWLAAEPELAPMRLSLLAPDAASAAAASTGLSTLREVRSAHWLGDLVPADQVAKLALIDLAYPSLLHAVEGAPADIAGTGAGTAGPVTPERLAARLEGVPGAAAAELGAALTAYAARRDEARDAALAESLFRYFPALIERLRLQLDAGEVTAAALPAPLRERYLSPSGIYRVEIAPAADLREPGALARFVDAVAAQAPGAAGPPAQIAGARRAVAGALLEAAGLALLGCALLALAVLRDPWRVATILLPLVLAAGVTAAASVLLGLPFNYANVIVLPLLIGLGIDSGIHFALRADRAEGSVFDTSTPRAVIYSALTTVAAFGTLAFSDHPGTASMGLLLVIAVGAAIVMVFGLTPALVRLARARR